MQSVHTSVLHMSLTFSPQLVLSYTITTATPISLLSEGGETSNIYYRIGNGRPAEQSIGTITYD